MSFLPSLKKEQTAKININLLPEDPFFKTFLGQTLRWALSVGRYIVIFTELLVILSFLARFTLDRQLTNLNDAIHQKKTVVESYGDLEDQFRLAQAKINQYQQIEQQANISDTFPLLTQIMPSGVQLEELIISPQRILMTGSTISQSSLNVLINNLQLSPDFTKISIDKIEANDQGGSSFDFSLRAETKQGATLTP